MLPLQGEAPGVLDQIQSFVIPETRPLLATTDVEAKASPNETCWQLVHPRIRHFAQPRFQANSPMRLLVFLSLVTLRGGDRPASRHSKLIKGICRTIPQIDSNRALRSAV